MLRFVEMCVEQRKGKLVKEGLHQYKNIAQNTSITTIEVRFAAYARLHASFYAWDLTL